MVLRPPGAQASHLEGWQVENGVYQMHKFCLHAVLLASMGLGSVRNAYVRIYHLLSLGPRRNAPQAQAMPTWLVFSHQYCRLGDQQRPKPQTKQFLDVDVAQAYMGAAVACSKGFATPGRRPGAHFFFFEIR